MVAVFTLPMKKLWVLLLILLPLVTYAQDRPEDGGREIQLWSGGGHSVSGGTGSTGVWNLGMRYGWILTRPHGPGFLKGRLEAAVDVVPAFLVFQPLNTAYGFGINPVNLKWNFATRENFVPYVELGGGTLFTNQEVPSSTSKENFTSGIAVGSHFLGQKYNMSLELRYMHISNAGLASLNPGINTVQVRLGFGRFLPSHRAPAQK